MYRRPDLPRGHGEVLTLPHYDEWAALADENAARALTWDFEIAGMPARELRHAARTEALAAAAAFSARLGVSVADVDDTPERVLVTGHQPELYHTGVWVKAFLLQRLAEEARAAGVRVAAMDIVVDSDSFDAVAVTSPCLQPDVSRCRGYLAVGSTDSCYGCSPVPSEGDLAAFRTAVARNLSTLPAPAIARHFEEFWAALDSARPDARNLAELLTFARRRYEAVAGTDYLELPVSAQARTSAYLRFVVHLARDAEAFARAYNQSLAAFRRATGTRSTAQPFPDLEIGEDGIEMPFWLLSGGQRAPLRVRRAEDEIVIDADDVSLRLPADADDAVAALSAAEATVAPRAATLTMFERLFVADLFMHGVGGGRYDAVTDDVIRRYFHIEPPRFTVASMTMYLPLGTHVIDDAEIERAESRLKRLEHNPDQLLGDVHFDSAEERDLAHRLAGEKSGLVEAIAAPDADKKALGARIREVNSELAKAMAPLAEDMRRHIASLHAQKRAADILTDRTYPFCFWSPQEISDKVR